MNQSVCKVISALNSSEVCKCLECLGYNYSIAPLKHYNNILRDKFTLDYNLKVFNANDNDIKSLALAIIKKVFNHEYINYLIRNNICMLSYNSVNNDVSNVDVIDIKGVLKQYLGNVNYCYILEDSNLKLILDIPAKQDVSQWKPILKKKESSIIWDLMQIGIKVNEIEIVFSFEGKELDEFSNAILELGFYIDK